MMEKKLQNAKTEIRRPKKREILLACGMKIAE